MVAIAGGMVGSKGGLGCGIVAEMSGEVAAGVERGPRGTPVTLSMTRMGTEWTLIHKSRDGTMRCKQLIT